MDARPRLLVVLGSTRPNRVGAAVGAWFVDQVRSSPAFEVEVADLAELRLPFLDEPHHPSAGTYTQEHTRRWSETVTAADAVVFVIPEYNHSFGAAVKNAVDFLFHEWSAKPVGLVTYGGVSGGTRAAVALRTPLTALGAYVVRAAVGIPFVADLMVDGRFQPTPGIEGAVPVLLDQLADALRLVSAVPAT
jgi:NAD(P)H-dependent FMN reductase